MYLVKFRWVFYGRYSVSIGYIYIFGNFWLSVLCWVLGEYWMCVFGKVSLSTLWRVLGAYWMCILDSVSLSVLWRVLGE